jgi:PAS domain S-box-containing protein
MLDPEMRYLVASERWRTLHNLANEDLLGRSHYQAIPGLPDRWKRVYARCLGGAVETCEGESIARPDGSVVSMKWEVRPWRRDDGEIGGIMIFNEILAAAADDGEPAPPTEEPAAESSRGFKTVMVATDERSVRTMVCEVLREKGCRVLRAGEGEEAIALAGAGEEDIDLLITDLVMPRMNGRDLAAELHKTNPRLKVLYISGYIGKASVRIAELGPGTSFLSKPFSPESLARKLRLLLDTAPAEPVEPPIDYHAI